MGISEQEFLHPESISDTLKCPATWWKDDHKFLGGIYCKAFKGLPRFKLWKIVGWWKSAFHNSIVIIYQNICIYSYRCAIFLYVCMYIWDNVWIVRACRQNMACDVPPAPRNYPIIPMTWFAGVFPSVSRKNYLLTTVFFFGIKHGGVAFTFASWAWAALGVSVILGSGTRSGTNQIIRVDIKRLCCTSPAHDCMVIPNPSVAIPHEEIQLWIAVWKYGTKKCHGWTFKHFLHQQHGLKSSKLNISSTYQTKFRNKNTRNWKHPLVN